MVLFAEFGFDTVFFANPTHRKIRPESFVLVTVFLEILYEVEERENVSTSTASDNDQCFVTIHCGKNLGLSIIKMFHNSTQNMSPLSLSTSYVDAYLTDHPVTAPISLEVAYQSLQNKTCPGNDFLGWIDLPLTIQESVSDIQQTAEKLRQISDVLIVCGIGGSYL